jgi:hypothetical protein
MKFKYRKTPDDTDPSKRWIARPILQVRLYYGLKHQDIRCLVDSGADDCLFHTSVGERLGIDVQAGRLKRFAGIAAGQFVDAYMHTIQTQIQGLSEKIDLEAGFTDSEWVYGILGQSGFFQNYRVTFERFRGRFEVTSRFRLRPPGT